MHHAELPAGRHGLQSGPVRLRLSRKRPVLPAADLFLNELFSFD